MSNFKICKELHFQEKFQNFTFIRKLVDYIYILITARQTHLTLFKISKFYLIIFQHKFSYY